MAPIAHKLKPTSLDDFYGQKHLISPNKPLSKMIENDNLTSLIFYGPPGVGKTTLANIIANTTNKNFISINATSASKKDLQAINKDNNTIIFIDEIHRFNKAQQDYLLPFMESGEIILIGATTENPYFEVNKALLSRSIIFEFKPLSNNDIKELITNSLPKISDKKIENDALEYLTRLANNDARRVLNLLEMTLSIMADKDTITIDDIKQTGQKPISNYDKDGDSHYNTISAFIKSMRGSDPDATIYYLAKMLNAGEDIKFIARRIMISASEDVGLANPDALVVATNAALAVERIGMPEARIILAQAAILNAVSPKSNASYNAINKAMKIAQYDYNIPDHLKDTHYKGAKNLNHGIDYKYAHDYKNHYVIQQYLPNDLVNYKFYEPTHLGYENYINQFKTWLINEEKNQN